MTDTPTSETPATGGEVLWVDMLCLRSFVRLLPLARRSKDLTVRYLNSTKRFESLLPFARRLSGATFEHAVGYDFGRTFIGGACLYEHVEHRIRESVERAVGSWRDSGILMRLCQRWDLDEAIAAKHLGKIAAAYVRRPITVACMAESHSQERPAYLFRKNPLFFAVQPYFSNAAVSFHPPPLLAWPYQARPLTHDGDYNHRKIYYGSPRLEFFRTVIFAIRCLLHAATGGDRSISAIAQSNGSHAPRIAVDRCVPFPFSFDEINEAYWWPKSGIPAEDVVMIADSGEVSEPDIAAAVEHGFSYIHMASPRQRRQVTELQSRHKNFAGVIGPGAGIKLAELLEVARQAYRCLWVNRSQAQWVNFYGAVFALRSHNRARLYRRLDVGIIWEMRDTNTDHETNKQAIRLAGGVSAGGHFSNYPYNAIDIEKVLDVMFSWGPFYAEHIFKDYDYRQVMNCGFYLDYYFEKTAAAARELRRKITASFVIAYVDQGMFNDFILSQKTHLETWAMFLRLLARYPEVVLVWKPKRNSIARQLMAAEPALKSAVEDGRIIVLYGESDVHKTPPVVAGMAADLVIGQTFNTAGLECYLAGTPTMFTDQSRLTRETVPASDQGSIFFDDHAPLEKRIEEIINDPGARHRFSAELDHGLDSHQDGQAYRRTGLFLRLLREELAGKDAERAIADARAGYDEAMAAGFPATAAAATDPEKAGRAPLTDRAAQN